MAMKFLTLDDLVQPGASSESGFLDLLVNKADKIFDKGLEIGESFFQSHQAKDLLSFQADLANQGFTAPGLQESTGGIQGRSALSGLIPVLLIGGVAVGAFMLLRK